jgi:hypothetical protein
MERCSLNEADELLKENMSESKDALYLDTIFKSSGKQIRKFNVPAYVGWENAITIL